MFFNRFGKQAWLARQSLVSQASLKTIPTGNDSDKIEGTMRRRAVAVALAAQIALPAGLLSRLTSASAADKPAGGNSHNPTAGVRTTDAFVILLSWNLNRTFQISGYADRRR